MNRGVSPIVGLLLMIVVTVVISAFVLTFSSSLVEKAEPNPVSFLDADIYKDAVVVKHIGGDPINIRHTFLVVNTKDGTYKIPFIEGYISRDVMLEIGDEKGLMLKECDYFDEPIENVKIFYRNKILSDISKRIVDKWYSPSFVVGYSYTNVDSFLGVVGSEDEIVVVGSKYSPSLPYRGLILFLDEFGNVKKAYNSNFTFRDVAKCSGGYIVVGYKYAMKVSSNGGVVWGKNYSNRLYLIHSVACKGDVCALVGYYSKHVRIVLINANNGNCLGKILSHDLTVDDRDKVPIRVFSVKDGWLVVGRTSGGKGFAGLFDDNLNSIFMKWFSNTYAIRSGTEADNGFILVGTTTGKDDVAVIKIDRSGNIVWAKKYDAGGGYEEAFGVYCDRVSKICLVVGHTNTGNNPTNLFVLKIDEINGKLLDSKVYDFGYSEYFDVIKPVFDYKNMFRGFIGGGRAGNYPMVVRINIKGEIWNGSSNVIPISFSESYLNTQSNSVTGYRTLSITPTNQSLSLSYTSVTIKKICKCNCYP